MTKRIYKDEPYLRAEHLLRGGKYQAVTVEIADVVWDCPGKKGDKDKLMKGLAFVGTDKVLGLNATNEGLVCVQTGEGKPENWKGHKIQLVVRLVRNKKKEEPGIRVWGEKPVPNVRLRDELGKAVPDDWYATVNQEQEQK